MLDNAWKLFWSGGCSVSRRTRSSRSASSKTRNKRSQRSKSRSCGRSQRSCRGRQCYQLVEQDLQRTGMARNGMFQFAWQVPAAKGAAKGKGKGPAKGKGKSSADEAWGHPAAFSLCGVMPSSNKQRFSVAIVFNQKVSQSGMKTYKNIQKPWCKCRVNGAHNFVMFLPRWHPVNQEAKAVKFVEPVKVGG